MRARSTTPSSPRSLRARSPGSSARTAAATGSAAVASITGLDRQGERRRHASVFCILYGGRASLTTADAIWPEVAARRSPRISRYTASSIFNLLCAPCFAAIGAIKREMNNAKWTCYRHRLSCACVAYCASPWMINQIGGADHRRSWLQHLHHCCCRYHCVYHLHAGSPQQVPE